MVVSSDTFPPTRVDVAVLFGVELAARGHEIDWILQSEAACPRAYVTQWGSGRAWVGATDLGQSLFSRVRKHVLGIANDCRLFSRLRHGRYDAIEVKDKFLSGIFAVIASRLFRTRFIYWLSYPFPEFYLLRARDGTARYPLLYRIRGAVFKVLLYRLLLPAADHIFVQSEQMRRDIAAEGIAAEKMTAVPMGVRADLCGADEPSAQRRMIAAGVPSVLYLGALDKVRRLDFLIRAMSRVLRVDAGGAALPRRPGRRSGGRGVPRTRSVAARAAIVRGFRRATAASRGAAIRPRGRCMRLAPVSDADHARLLADESSWNTWRWASRSSPMISRSKSASSRRAAPATAFPTRKQAFADAIVRLLEDPEAARSMGQRGRRYVLEHRTYAAIAAVVERQFLDVVGRC